MIEGNMHFSFFRNNEPLRTKRISLGKICCGGFTNLSSSPQSDAYIFLDLFQILPALFFMVDDISVDGKASVVIRGKVAYAYYEIECACMYTSVYVFNLFLNF